MAHAQHLRRHLAKLLFATIVPLLALAGLLTYQVVASERDTRLRAMQDLARTLSSAVDAEVNQTVLALQLLATSSVIDRLDLEELRARFEEAKGLHGRWSSMSLFKVDGTRLLNLREPPGQPIPSNPEAWERLDAAVRAGRVFISGVVVSSTSGKPTVFFGVPVFRGGVPVYGITATMEYDVWTGWLKQRIPEDAIAAIDDQDGVIFARSERPEPFAGKAASAGVRKAYVDEPSGIVRNKNREGVDIYAAHSTSALTGWHTLVILPAAIVDAGPYRYGLAFAATTAAVLLLTLGAALFMARPLARGIGHLHDSIRRVGQGERPVPATSPIAEIDEAEQAARQAAERLAAARDELLHQREELRTMLDLLPVGVAVAHDTKADEVTVSPMFREIFGLRHDDTASLGGAAGGVIPHRCLQNGEEIPAAEMPLQRAARSGAAVRDVEFDVELPDGKLLHILVNAAPLFDRAGQVRGAIAAHIDVTSLKHAQQALQQADRQKNEFLVTLAHELRNPMAPIRYATALLKPDASQALIDQARGTIERQSTHMARLLDDLIDLSRISRNVIELKRELVDLQAIVRAAVDNARPLAEELHHTLLLQPAPHALWVHGDPARLLQIMDNLLSNACKYTPQGGSIVVATSQAGDRCLVRVTDSGVGLTPDMIPKMFSLFGQAHRSPGAAQGGLGIGLTVVRRVVDLHGGTIDVHSAGLGAGSSFVVQLPLAAAPGAERRAAVEPARVKPSRRLSVLVVDDNVDAADMLACVLQLSGYEVRTAHTAAAALAVVAEWRPDVAILDIGLPDTSGNDLARSLRSRPSGGDLLLLAVTGWGQAEDRDRTAKAGFDAHLVKPVDPQEVIRVIEAFAEARTDRPAASTSGA